MYSLNLRNRIHRQNEMIANAHRTVAETEEVGMEITSELARNREKIEGARSKVSVFDYIFREFLWGLILNFLFCECRPMSL